MSRPPLHMLLGFAAAARAGNLTRAAESMHLTVSALSHQIRALEERLSRRLFVRGARGVTLTADGERLWTQVGPHLEALEQALQPFAPRHDDRLTVSVLPSMASGWLVPRLGDFLAAHPQLQLNLFSSERLVDFDRDTEIDAAVRMGPGQWPGVIAEHLLDEVLVPVASPALLRRHGVPTDATLHLWPLIGEEDDTWDRWFERFGAGRPQRYVAHFDRLESLQRAAVDGMGVALARLVRSRLLIEAGQLVVLSTHSLPSENYNHYLVYPPRSADHAGLQAFREWLHAQAKGHSTRLEPPPPTRAGKRRLR